MKSLIKDLKIINFLNALIYLVMVILLFVLIKEPSKGHLAPWSLAIISGLLGIASLILPLSKMKGNGIIHVFLLLNVLMIIFSVLDMAHVGNHYISTLVFMTVPVGTIIASAIRK